jgi:hypothetical protein
MKDVKLSFCVFAHVIWPCLLWTLGWNGCRRNFEYVAVLCPEGTRQVNNTVCQECSVGMYNPTSGADSCSLCTTNSSTFTTGAVSNAECAGNVKQKMNKGKMYGVAF